MEKPLKADLVYVVKEPSELVPIAVEILAPAKHLILLKGDLGSGKTTFVKYLCRSLGSSDEITSPTFTLINEYRDREDHPIFHVDLYRLNTLDEAMQIGIEDLITEGSWCFIEWPEIIEPVLAGEYVQVEIEALSDGRRRICILK